MKTRITYILDGNREFTPSQLKVAKDHLNVAEVPVDLREDRVTFSLDEVQPEVRQALQQTHELHIRWQSAALVCVPEPFNSRVAPGLHVHYTPLKQQDK